ncbi:MAG TPA: Uma2 family endonuclease [Sphingomonas sp.]|jgi:Uma2 family endonuclease|nr:Uma2 family endonuclease [Sphingomonas sp.]
MRADPAYRKITAEEFLAMDFATDRRFELDDGVIVMMAGGTEAHAWVQGNVFAWLRQALRGSGCRPYGPDMALRINDTDVRYPDISIYCGRSPSDDQKAVRALTDPAVVIEILSPSTTTLDQGTKLDLYKSLPSIRTIAFVDPATAMTRTVERTSSTAWLDQIFSATRGIVIPTLGIAIPHDEIFARD